MALSAAEKQRLDNMSPPARRVNGGLGLGTYLGALLTKTGPTAGLSTGTLKVKVMASAELKAKLDTNENNLFSVAAGELPIHLGIQTGTAAGAACVADLGFDATADGSAKDADGWVVDANVNSAGTDDNFTNPGAYANDVKAAAAAGNIIITSSTDQSSSSFEGWAFMIYLAV
jgi:hypothetical protein